MDWQKERQEFFIFLQKETGIDTQHYYEKWLYNRGCFWSLSVDEIIYSACNTLGITKDQLISDSAKRILTDARKIVCHHLRSKLNTKLIASELKYADHSTVVTSQKQYHTL